MDSDEQKPLSEESLNGDFQPPAAEQPQQPPAGITVGQQQLFRCGESSSGLTTNFVNPSFPANDTNEAAVDDRVCAFLLRIQDTSICQVRVDFVDTRLIQPVRGECSRQHLSVRGTVWPLGFQQLCGNNYDQHFYVEVDRTVPT